MANRGKGSSGGEQHQCHLPPKPQARMLCGLWGKEAQGSSANLGKVQCDLGKSLVLCAPLNSAAYKNVPGQYVQSQMYADLMAQSSHF